MAGVQYGLSSQGNFNENKSLIFVKLTDSAYRAIEDYIRNKVRHLKIFIFGPFDCKWVLYF